MPKRLFTIKNDLTTALTSIKQQYFTKINSVREQEKLFESVQRKMYPLKFNTTSLNHS